MTWLRFSDFDTHDKRAQRFGLLRQWGVKGVKLDFIDSEAQERLQLVRRDAARDLADNQLMVNFHGSTVPKGINRTWPQVMSMEGVHGAEKSSNLTTSHLTTLPFTRNESAPWTTRRWPSSAPAGPPPTRTSWRLSVVFESGLQDLAGHRGVLPGPAARPNASSTRCPPPGTRRGCCPAARPTTR